MKKQTQSTRTGLDTFDHVVVLMLENRSFDNLLGYLYEDGVPEGKSFEGLQNGNFEVPVPKRAKDFKEHPTVKVTEALDYHQPFPDPGEVYQHVNTQIFNHVDNDNIGVEACKMSPPYNIPQPIPSGDDLMKGFINDYINTLDAMKPVKPWKGQPVKDYRNPGFDEYSVIMQCFKPKKIPVLTTLAKEFAVFDHWFCSVPSQTWCNRAFWHAGTSGGQVINPTDECGILPKGEAMARWIKDVWSQPNLFQRMAKKGISHAVYKEGIVALTSLVTGLFKGENVKRAGTDLKRFKKDLKKGRLPKYSFVEPKFMGQHNDQHPSSAGQTFVDGRTRVGTVLLGEKLIYDIYMAIKNSDQYRDNTLLIITYDEHGGCFDHVPPPAVVPPKPGMKGDKGFGFNRLGIRVPMVMVSAYIQKNTIMNDVFDHTSFIRTMCEKWDMPGLTDRDKNANMFSDVFSEEKREFPPVPKPNIPDIDESAYNADPLNDLQKSILTGADHMARQHQAFAADVVKRKGVEDIQTVGEAIKHLENIKDFLVYD